MKQSIDSAWDDHPTDPDDQEDTPSVWWMVNVVQVDWAVDPRDDLRIQVTLEVPGTTERVTAHLDPASAKRLRSALTTALKTMGADD